MSHDDSGEELQQSSRRRSIKLRWGDKELEIRGYDILILILVACVPFASYFLYELKTNGEASHNQILQALEVQTYVLSLSQDRRDALNISMPKSLREKIRRERFQPND